MSMRPSARAMPPRRAGLQAKPAGFPTPVLIPSVIVTQAPSRDEPVFRAYGSQILEQMRLGGLYAGACSRVGLVDSEAAWSAALAEVDSYLAQLDPEFAQIVNGSRVTVSRPNASFLHFWVSSVAENFRRGGSIDGRTALMNARDRAARLLAQACGRKAAPLVTYSVAPIVLWQPPVFFGGPRGRGGPSMPPMMPGMPPPGAPPAGPPAGPPAAPPAAPTTPAAGQVARSFRDFVLGGTQTDLNVCSRVRSAFDRHRQAFDEVNRFLGRFSRRTIDGTILFFNEGRGDGTFVALASVPVLELQDQMRIASRILAQSC